MLRTQKSDHNEKKTMEAYILIVSGFSISALQRVKISTANSAIVTFNSFGGSIAHLQLNPVHSVRKNLSFAAPLSCVSKRM